MRTEFMVCDFNVPVNSILELYIFSFFQHVAFLRLKKHLRKNCVEDLQVKNSSNVFFRLPISCVGFEQTVSLITHPISRKL